ncbi:unnamed protein product [Larinioides sclopetarius]|uniref:Uncharacterized protein n=1 Tax=Larinioides sclopetarius TaxID=280406 RepID=A0AAV2BFA8_9ARAC
MENHSDVSRFLFFTLNVFLLLNQVSAYYCNHDLCREDQYCCGDNLCCDYVYSPWYFWCWWNGRLLPPTQWLSTLTLQRTISASPSTRKRSTDQTFDRFHMLTILVVYYLE